MKQGWLIIAMMLGLSAGVRAEESSPAPLDLPDEVPAKVVPVAPPESEEPMEVQAITPAPEPAQAWLKFGLRFDPGFSVGSPVQQGFVLNSARLSVFGEKGAFDYRFSLGQTREFSSALLPQITPVEAYLRGRTDYFEGGEYKPALRAKLGMFTPHLHPLWSPDLSDLDIIDYSPVHREVLIGRDLGAEVELEIPGAGLILGGGAFNGGGITAINSNNTKAFTGFLEKRFEGQHSHLTLGVSGYWLGQSSRGSINFKMISEAMAYADLNLWDGKIRLVGEIFGEQFEDSTLSADLSGGGAWIWFEIVEGFRLFAHEEWVSGSTSGSGAGFNHLTIGPMLDLTDDIKIFAHYDWISFDNGTVENQMLIRARLNL